MFNSILGATIAIDSLILNIFIILGVVIAGAVIVYLLWEAVNVLIQKNKNQNSSVENNVVYTNKEKDDEPIGDFVLDEDKTEEIVEIDQQKAEEEQAMHEAELSDEERENVERRAYLEARRQELIKRMQAEMEEDAEDEQVEEAVEEENDVVAELEEQSDVEEEIAEVVEPTEEVSEEAEEEVVAEEDSEVTEESKEEVQVAELVEESVVDPLEEERKALESEKARYQMMVKELEDAKRALAEQLNEEPVKVVETIVETRNLSLEELEQRLADAEERLRITEKEFKQCKKEYIPLKRVWNAHEKDEKKLRRKEALVAKQKVLLYGVNNYADIDEEKAQKLAEDLDLLDGLKLSVQHCEEVMKKNEERYPLLEKMYNVLKLRNDELKKDIAKYKAEIEQIKAENADAE